MTCGTSDNLNCLDTSSNQTLVHSAIAIFFEHVAKRLFGYLRHHPTESFSNEMFVRVLKSTVLDEPDIAGLQVLVQSACVENIVLDEIDIDCDLKDKVINCIELVCWMKTAFAFEIDIMEWGLTRGLLLGGDPDATNQELQEKFLTVYGDCESCGVGPFEECDCPEPAATKESPPNYDDRIDCTTENRCDICTKVDDASARYNPEAMKSTLIGDILHRSIERQEMFGDEIS